MAWIESHQEVERHPKTLRLMTMMQWNLDETIGKLHRFWWWCVAYAPDGDLRKFNDAILATAVGLNPDDGKRFVDAMVECGGEAASGFIDRTPYFRIHDWWDRIGMFLQIKFKHQPEKWQEIKNLYYNGSNNGCENSTPNQPNLTKPTKPKKTCAAPAALEEAFQRFWTAYPKRRSRGDALKAWRALNPSEEQVSRILAAIDRAKRSADWVKDGGQFIPYPGTWIRAQGWEDEIATGGSRGPNGPSSALDRLLDRESGHNSAPKTDFKVPSLLSGMDKA